MVVTVGVCVWRSPKGVSTPGMVAPGRATGGGEERFAQITLGQCSAPGADPDPFLPLQTGLTSPFLLFMGAKGSLVGRFGSKAS